MTFGVVAFTIIVQGITMKPLIRFLGIGQSDDDDYSRARVRQVAIASALSELDTMAGGQLISRPVYEQLHQELEARQEDANKTVDTIFGENKGRLTDEFQVARRRLKTTERSAIEQAMHDGWVSANTAAKLIEETDVLPDASTETSPKPSPESNSKDPV